MFLYHLKQHYSQTQDGAGEFSGSVFVPSKTTLLSNDYEFIDSIGGVFVPSKTTLLSNCPEVHCRFE